MYEFMGICVFALGILIAILISLKDPYMDDEVFAKWRALRDKEKLLAGEKGEKA